MKSMKKMIAFVLTLAMVVTLITINPTDASAKVTLKSKKKVTLTVGKTSKIKVKEKGAKYKTSNKKIATVNKKGKITAKKPGTCKVTVSVGKSKKKVTVKVNLANVTISSANLVTTNSAKVAWNKVKGATGYNVYYSTNASSGFKAVQVNGASTTSTTIGDLAIGSTYYFKVKALAKVGKKNVLSPKFSEAKSVRVYKLVWNDEFGGTKLDATKWNNEGATGAGGYGNNELQNYQMKYCEVKDDNLVIKPQFEWNPRTKKTVPNKYYSTKLWTKDLYSLTYGKVEFRAKLPKGKGTWAACWMLGNQSNYGAWPKCGEIDVLETTRDLTKTIIPQSIHNERFNGMSTSSGNKYKHTTVSDATSAYHTYGIIWTEEAITFTIDGKETWTYEPTKYVASGNAYAQKNIWPFDKPFYLIINCAIGGTLGGDVGPDYWTKIGTEEYKDNKGNITAVNDIYQDYMYVDYVRVYQ